MIEEKCPICNSENIEIEEKDYEVAFKSRFEKVKVPMRKCVDCDFEYLNYEAEMIIDAYLEQLRKEE